MATWRAKKERPPVLVDGPRERPFHRRLQRRDRRQREDSPTPGEGACGMKSGSDLFADRPLMTMRVSRDSGRSWEPGALRPERLIRPPLSAGPGPSPALGPGPAGSSRNGNDWCTTTAICGPARKTVSTRSRYGGSSAARNGVLAHQAAFVGPCHVGRGEGSGVMARGTTRGVRTPVRVRGPARHHPTGPAGELRRRAAGVGG